MKGFFAGSLPNAARIVLKNFYRYPLMVGTPQAITDYTGIKNQQALKGLTGGSIALIESFILCPFERLKVYLMTRDTTKTKFRGNMLSELFRGYVPLLTRQCVAWVAFL